MRNWMWVLAIAATMLFGASLSAQIGGPSSKGGEKPAGEEKKEGDKEGEKEGEGEKEADPLETYKAMFKDIDTVVGKQVVTEATIKAFLDNNKSFHDAMKGDKKFDELKDKNMKEAFEYAVKAEKAVAWAKEKNITLDTWLRDTLRIMILTMHKQIADMIPEQKKAIADQRALVEKSKADLTEEEYAEYIKQLDAGDKALKDWEAFNDTLPKGTEAETKLIDANAEKVSEAMDHEDSEEGEKDGGEGDDDDDDMG